MLKLKWLQLLSFALFFMLTIKNAAFAEEINFNLSKNQKNSPVQFIDDTVNLFFPKSLSSIQYSQTLFSIFWWNFIIIEPQQNGDFSWQKSKELCNKLRQFQDQELGLIVCGENQWYSFKPLLKEWAQDLIRRQIFPSQDVEQQIWLKRSRQTLSQLDHGKTFWNLIKT
jgi:hypothetical protein